jgi:hypothetical protein
VDSDALKKICDNCGKINTRICLKCKEVANRLPPVERKHDIKNRRKKRKSLSFAEKEVTEKEITEKEITRHAAERAALLASKEENSGSDRHWQKK